MIISKNCGKWIKSYLCTSLLSQLEQILAERKPTTTRSFLSGEVFAGERLLIVVKYKKL